jgi:uncharacterized protein
MHKNLQNLMVLQDRDSALQKMETEMRKIPVEVEKAKQKLNHDQAVFDDEKLKLKELEVKAAQLQLERRTRQSTLEKLRARIFETSKESEIVALGTEVKRYEKVVDEYETEELVVLENVDKQKGVTKGAEEALEKRKTLLNEQLAGFEEKARVMIARFKDAKAERQQVAGGINEQALELYERVLKSKKTLAVAELCNGTCLGCNIKVVASTLASVRADREFVQCENCACILYEL